MKCMLPFAIVFSLMTAFGQTPADTSLRTELLVRAEMDQEVRQHHILDRLQNGQAITSDDVRALDSVDILNTTWIKSAISQSDWPGFSRVGGEGEAAAFLLVQHADRDTAFQASCLQLLADAFERGETTGEHFGLLSDRVAVAAGRPQLYGSQTYMVDGRFLFRPILDSASVDLRRAKLGMMPLTQYKAIIDSVYGESSVGHR
jgi:hypothetical protein